MVELAERLQAMQFGEERQTIMIVHVEVKPNGERAYSFERSDWTELFSLRVSMQLKDDEATIALFRQRPSWRAVPGGRQIVWNTQLYAKPGLVWLIAICLASGRAWRRIAGAYARRSCLKGVGDGEIIPLWSAAAGAAAPLSANERKSDGPSKTQEARRASLQDH